jgi:hypothetical protein
LIRILFFSPTIWFKPVRAKCCRGIRSVRAPCYRGDWRPETEQMLRIDALEIAVLVTRSYQTENRCARIKHSSDSILSTLRTHNFIVRVF